VALLGFGSVFKSTVISDPRILLLGSALDGEKDPEAVEDGESSAQRAYNFVAKMMGQPDMKTILELFANKMYRLLDDALGSRM